MPIHGIPFQVYGETARMRDRRFKPIGGNGPRRETQTINPNANARRHLLLETKALFISQFSASYFAWSFSRKSRQKPPDPHS